MPNHGLVPYRVGLREKGDRGNYWNLKNLKAHDTTLSNDNFVDMLENFLEEHQGKLKSNNNSEKTFLVRDFHRDGDLIEGIVSTGDYGYEAELRDITTGKLTHRKGEVEAELVPFYFIFWVPKTINDNLYQGGERGLLTFQSINGKSIKTEFSKRLYSDYLGDAENTMSEMSPVYVQKALEKLVNSRSVKAVEFEVDEMPSSGEQEVQFIEGLDSHDTETQLITLKPKRGNSLTGIRKIAKQLQRDGGSFAQVVDDDVEDLKIEIINEHGRRETIRPMELDMKMTVELDPDDSQLNGGLPTTKFVSGRAQDLINTVLPQGEVTTLNHTTHL